MAGDQVQEAKHMKFIPVSEQAEQAREGQVVSDEGMSKIGILGKQLKGLEEALVEAQRDMAPPLDPKFIINVLNARETMAAIQDERLRQSPHLKYGEDHPVQAQANVKAEQVQAGKLITLGTRSAVAQDNTFESGPSVGNVSALASLGRGELLELRRSVGAIRQELVAYMRAADPAELQALDQVAQVLNEMDIAFRDKLEAAQQTAPERQSRAA